MLKFTVQYPEDEGLQEVVNANALLNYYLDSNMKDLFLDQFCRKVVKEVDKSDIISTRAIDSPYLGGITPSQLSGGTSTILATYFLCKEGSHKFYIRSEFLGENCIPYLLELTTDFDITIVLTAPLNITEQLFKEYPNVVYSLEENVIVNTAKQYERIVDKYEEKLETLYEEEEYEDPEFEKFMWKIIGKQTAELLGMEWNEDEDGEYNE